MPRIAIAQLPGVALSDWRQTLTQIDAAIARAAELQAEIVLLPECAFPAYYLGSIDAYRQARRTGLPSSQELLTRIAGHCRTLHLAVCIGYVEERGGHLFNAATLLGTDGAPLLTHRKCFLWDFDHDCFTPGDKLDTADTPYGRIGLLICADARQPEIAHTLVRRGARLLLQPTAWVNAGTAEQPWNPQPEFLIPTRARELGVPIASASKWGPEGPTCFVGSSLIVDHAGRTLAQCPPDASVVAIAEVVPGQTHPPAIDADLRQVLQSPWQPPADEPRELRLAALLASAAESFVLIRAAALRGADLIVLYGPAHELSTLRTRAAENRVFLACELDGRPRLIHPNGRVVEPPKRPDSWTSVSLLDARNKYVAPRTNPLADRRPELYDL